MIEETDKFEYDRTQGYDWNFEKWYRWNCRERRAFLLKEYTKEQALIVFDEMFINLK